MIDGDGDDATCSIIHEALGKYRSVLVVDESGIDGVVENRMAANRRDRTRLEYQPDAYGIGTDRTGRYVVVGTRAHRVIEAGNEVAGGRIPVVVLDFDQTHDVCVDPDQGVNELGALARKLFGVVCAAAFQVHERPADIVEAVIDGREVIENVEGGHRGGPVHGIGRQRAQIVIGVIRTHRRLYAIQAECEVQHSAHILHTVPAPEQVREIEDCTVRMNGRIRILAGAAVVERDAIELVLGFRLDRIRAGFEFRCRRQSTLGTQHDLAEAVEVEVFHDNERLREGNPHALGCFEVVHARHRQGKVCGAWQRVAAALDDDARSR